MDDRWPAGYAGLLAGTACHESEQLSQKKRTNDPKISLLLAPLGPAAAIANQRRCVVSGLICDTSAHCLLSPQLLSVAAAMAELPLMGNARTGKAGCSKSVDPRISVSAYWAGPRAVCQSPPNSRIGEPSKGPPKGHSFGLLVLPNLRGILLRLDRRLAARR
jgi:hypothetical protein